MFILHKFFPEAMDLSAFTTDETSLEFQKQNMLFIEEYQSLIMMFYVPLYAVMSKIVIWSLLR